MYVCIIGSVLCSDTHYCKDLEQRKRTMSIINELWQNLSKIIFLGRQGNVVWNISQLYKTDQVTSTCS